MSAHHQSLREGRLSSSRAVRRAEQHANASGKDPRHVPVPRDTSDDICKKVRQTKNKKNVISNITLEVEEIYLMIYDFNVRRNTCFISLKSVLCSWNCISSIKYSIKRPTQN